MKKISFSKRVVSAFLCVALMMAYIPLFAIHKTGALSSSAVSQIIADPGTAYTWESMLGTNVDGNRYSGRVWVDKSVYKHGDTAILNTKGESGSSFEVSLKDDEALQVIFSALGSTMTTTTTTVSGSPIDVVLVLDTSTSMDDTDNQGITRLQRTIEAANGLLDDLLTLNDVRIAIVTYNRDSETVIPLAAYNNGIELVVTDYFNNGSSDAGVVTAYDKDNRKLGNDSGYTMGTNLQSGIDRGFNILANATDVEGRVPVAIVLTDGQANRANRASFYSNINEGNSASGRSLYLSTLLNAAYNKAKVEQKYGVEQIVYGVGVDLGTNTTARLLMNPGDTSNKGFNSTNTSSDVRNAYNDFLNWSSGNTVRHGNGSSAWSFDHNYPNINGTITDAKIAANINYVDTYFDVSNADLSTTFSQIYEELSSGVFNPISSSTSVNGATGVDNTPLIYVDFIGQYMEIKNIQAVTLFGSSYNVVKKNDGTYVVETATGRNPTTNEAWNTAEDIIITVTEQTDGTQKLEIKINQEILPIILEQVVSETVGGVTTATITELMQSPLRVYYTVGIDSDILLPNGEVDVTKIQGYEYIDDANGTVSFYSNKFGVMNPADSSGVVIKGDTHVGFKPSDENRYYYHQDNQGIFTQITNKSNGSVVAIPENAEYGIVWDEDKYNLSWMTYDEYQNTNDTDKVYTYVTYYHPTPSAQDDANAAEEVTYLVYTDWAYLKESVAFYDNNAKKYVNYDSVNGYTLSDTGVAIDVDKVADVIAAYKRANPNADIYAVLGVGSVRTSRFHNMTSNKSENITGTAVERYTPEYTHDTASQHNGNDVVVWLGNSGKVTLNVATGIALTKNVTKPIGDADDTYALTVTIPNGVTADPVVVDSNGNDVTNSISSYSSNVLTVNVKAGETVYISGIPGGTVCQIGEIINGDYYKEESLSVSSVTVPTLSQVLNATAPVAQFVPAVVTNTPNEYGNLYITKEITSTHAVPESVMDTEFDITVNVGSALAGKTFEVMDSAHTSSYNKTVDANGNLTFSIKAKQTVEILKVPAGTAVTVTEATPGSHFTVSYRTRNHSGINADTDNKVVIPTDGSATAVVFNNYTPSAVTVDLDIAGTKNFTVEGNHNGGTFNFKVQKWNGSAWEDISGKTAQVPYLNNESGTKNFRIEDVLAGITYTEVGSYAYQVLEVKGNVDNVTYDRTLYTFTVNVTDNGGQLVATVTDINNTAITDGSYDVVFNNTYHTAPVSIDIVKDVVNKSGDNTVSKAGFEFNAVRTDANWNALTGQDASTLTVFSDAAGEARLTATYKTAGKYYYVLTEVNRQAAGWTYSGAAYRITVTVTENNGELSASLNIVKTESVNANETASVDAADATKGKVSFENTYDPDDATVELDGAVRKELTGKALEAGQFTFYVYNDGDRSSSILTGTNGFNGNVNAVDFNKTLTFDKVGVYNYDIIENIPDGAVYDSATGKYVLNGMSYDPTIFDLVVEVSNDTATGKLVASYYFEDSISNVVTFHNSYKAKATEYSFGGTKVLHGRAPKIGEFSFELYEGNTLIQTVSNKVDGTFAFNAISYTEVGTHTYTIKEVNGNVAGVSYTGVDHPVTVTVTVTDTNGVLSASGNVSNADIKFENTYTAKPAEVKFNGTKELKGTALADNSFTFKLYKTDNSFDITKNTAELVGSAKYVNGAFAFTRTLDTTGTHFFVIVEDATVDTIADVVYDRTVYKFIVQVTDNGDGQLKAALTNVNTGVTGTAAATVTGNASFTNATFDEVTEKEVYIAGNSTTQIDGKKVNAGDVITYYITYTNYTGENVVVDIMDTIPDYTSYVEGTASHNGTYVGTHINWILNVAKGESVTVSFNVKVNETESIFANTAVVRDGVNTYSTNEVVNHTVEEELKKDVFYPTNTEVSIDGKKVYEGEELLYKISFTNTSDDKVDIKITDKIPENTTYVTGSADNGGVYNNGTLVWNIEDVPAWSTVEVTFKVTVNSGIGAVRIENQATATDGTNNFTTEKVTNYTVKDEVEKKVYNSDAPTANIDGKEVECGDILIYEITYKNTSSEKVSVTITDTVPVYTTYIGGTADNDGVYKDGVLTWVLEVEAGASVTVSFKVKVDNLNAKATVKNKAVVVEGKNTYTTNEVSTPTTNPVAPPQTGINPRLWMWSALMFVSGSGVIGTALFGRKRKTEEQ